MKYHCKIKDIGLEVLFLLIKFFGTSLLIEFMVWGLGVFSFFLDIIRV